MAAVSEKAKENQRKYKQEFAKNKYSRVPLDVSKEYHEYIKEVAKAQGMTLTAYIKEAIEEKSQNVKDEIPEGVILNAMNWLKEHGHSDDDIVDFLKAIGKK